MGFEPERLELLFLGAGASKPFGPPTMKEFTDVVIQDVVKHPGTGFEKIIRGIQSQVSKRGIEPDIEAILSVLQGKSKPVRTWEDVGYSEIRYPDEFNDMTPVEVDKIVRPEIEDAIFNHCVKIDRKMATQLYGDLWASLTADFATGPNSTYSPGTRLVERIFTTNYDLSVETFLKRRPLDFSDGFQIELGDPIFATQWRGPINLFKLHGSINYYNREDGNIVRSDAILEGADLYGREIKGRMMIYPSGEKYATRWPFYEYLGQLRHALVNESTCIVIGYSFRDIPINNAFLDAIQKNPRLRIMLVSRSADRVRDSLDENLRERVTPLQREFGDKHLPQLVMEQVRKWLS